MMAHLVQFWRNNSGATAIEYGLIAGLISVVILTALTTVGGRLNNKFQNIAAKLN